jgi:hypothetical protein
MRNAWLEGRRSSLPVASALGSSAVSVDQCARWRSPWKLKPSWIVAGPPVARHRVEGHAPGAHVLVAGAPAAVAHHLEVVVGGRAGDAVGPRDAELVLGAVVVGLDVGQPDGPIELVVPSIGP